ncbi:SMI1/KNR4 family protein, partial [Streptomyces lonarensis]|uniref:SMI1/KNR4 family protein n=1 Tax=Streptomyces lonarensis TaxID=700599 RepID=UPI001ADDA7AD
PPGSRWPPPDTARLRELVLGSPAVSPAGGAAAPSVAAVAAAERVTGPLPPSFRWWLTTFGGGRIGGAETAVVAPSGWQDEYDAVTAPWRREERPGLLACAEEPDGARYWFDLTERRADGECPVLCDAGDGLGPQPFAATFAGFPAVVVALATGQRHGPNPAVAELWRQGPGVMLPCGVQAYGPDVLPERNATYEVARWAPDWVLVGDDSGGAGLLMRRHGADRSSVYLLGLGALEPDVAAAGERVTGDLGAWLTAGAPR